MNLGVIFIISGVRCTAMIEDECIKSFPQEKKKKSSVARGGANTDHGEIPKLVVGCAVSTQTIQYNKTASCCMNLW